MQTALSFATWGEHEKLVKLLLSNGADPNIKPDLGSVALVDAATRCNSTIALLLLDAGANVDITTSEGVTPLIESARKGNAKMVKILLNHGASLDCIDDWGNNALKLSIARGFSTVRDLLTRRKEWNEQDHWSFPKPFREEAFLILLMWNHDQYAEGECDDFPWNELPFEVIKKIISHLAL
eukprot:TRINITY_DN32633_c0_g1_i1.p1 TRINITY_DN32633_c0_g1~~TRINITY_DN32633_c0_g1_i1.p1  ORF type:complete len:194 (+),score=49.38 TRINITY_DN32633_c0_g1_i1:41-583(+)